MPKVILLGANGALGRIIASQLIERGIDFTRVVREQKQAIAGERCLFWDYKSRPPEPLLSAEYVINCARGASFLANVEVAKWLAETISPSTQLILFGSNCIYAQPSGAAARFFFSGDAYICEKRSIEKIAAGRNNITVVRPTIVVDEGGWADFLSSLTTASRIHVPQLEFLSRLKVTSCDDVATHVVDLINNTGELATPTELFSEITSLNDFLGNTEIVADLSNNTFTEGFFHNLAITIFCSWLTPFWLKASIQQRALRAEKKQDDKCASDSYLSGMTRLYLCGRHTHQ